MESQSRPKLQVCRTPTRWPHWSGAWGVALLLAGCAPARPAELAPAPAAEEAIVLETESGSIHGTLRLPATDLPVPVALIIAGSGPTDRNGNLMGLPGSNDSYRMLAEALAERGIATVRYDKRGIAGSAAAAPSEAELRFDTYVEDAASWIALLGADSRFSSVVPIGHSEGSLVGMIAAREGGAAGFVSLAGIARRASDVLRDQLRRSLPAPLLARSEEILQRLEQGEQVDSVPPELAALYRPSVQPYLISWFRYVPGDEIGRLNIPTLIVQGTTDVQVGVAEAQELARHGADARLEIIEGMNHVLKRVSGGLAEQQPSYYDPTLPVVEEMVDLIAEFMERVD